jgi:uncharacterized alpha-E superfamily protein
MLSRVAEAMYWMSRYLERAENIARFAEVNWHLALDMPAEDNVPSWEALVRVTGDYELFLDRHRAVSPAGALHFLTFDPAYANSVFNCLGQARENARSIRDRISPEMWESINTTYHAVADMAGRAPAFDEEAMAFYRRIKMSGMLVGGIAAATLNHDESWHFFRLGRCLERADKTTRMLDVKYFILLPDVRYVGTPYDDLQWSALLRSTSALEAYRQRHGRIAHDKVIEFLLLDRQFPRAVLKCLLEADESLHAISGAPLGAYRNEAEQALGPVAARLSYLNVQQIIRDGVHEFLDALQFSMNRVDDRIGETFFGRPVPGAVAVEP